MAYLLIGYTTNFHSEHIADTENIVVYASEEEAFKELRRLTDQAYEVPMINRPYWEVVPAKFVP
jgi:hypothetical protein